MRTRLLCGAGVVEQVADLARELGAQRIFLVTDPGIVAAGHAQRVTRCLTESSLDVRIFQEVRENPTSTDVQACLAALGDWDVQLIVGLGGGSSMDVAKGCALLRAAGGCMEDHRGRGRTQSRLLPILAIPTTAGTGSEVQSFALISQPGSHQKMACGDPQLAPRLALLDATLCVTLPRKVTACTGLDALGHALETAVTTRRNPISQLFSHKAFQLVQANLPQVLADGSDLQARACMLRAAAFAGIAIEHSMLGAAHALANPLTAQHGIPHGQAVGLMLPAVVRHNAQDQESRAIYANHARSARLCPADVPDDVAVKSLLECLDQLLQSCDLEPSLAAHGISQRDLPSLAAQAAEQWTARFNPRQLTVQDFVHLLQSAGPAAS